MEGLNWRDDRVIKLLDSMYAPYVSWVRPFVTVSYAQMLDGSIGTSSGPLSISCDSSWTMTHCLRSWHDSILVGAGTLSVEDPSLTTRRVLGRHPRPIVIDPNLRISKDKKILNDPSRKPILVYARSNDVESAERTVKL